MLIWRVKINIVIREEIQKSKNFEEENKALLGLNQQMKAEIDQLKAENNVRIKLNNTNDLMVCVQNEI